MILIQWNFYWLIVFEMEHLPIAVDVLGGDYAPESIIEGAIEANVPVILVGPEKEITSYLKKAESSSLISLHPAESSIGMDENPLQAIRTKKNSSLMVSIRLVKEGKAAGVMSAGNTGALTMGATTVLGRLPNIDRPGAAIPIPNPKGLSLLLDAGAAAECYAEDLVKYAIMGSTYVKYLWGIENPRIALLSIGEEESKGSRQAREAHKLLKASGLNFIGNVEGSDLGSAIADVIVTDGFTGNVALKVAEGVANLIMKIIKDELESTKGVQRIAAGAIKPVISRLKTKLDWQEYGGGALLGISGNVVIAHGKSKAKAISSAIKLAADLSRSNILIKMEQELIHYYSNIQVKN